jgi:hypothetical protein
MAAISHQSVPGVAADEASDANRNQAGARVRPPQIDDLGRPAQNWSLAQLAHLGTSTKGAEPPRASP